MCDVMDPMDKLQIEALKMNRKQRRKKMQPPNNGAIPMPPGGMRQTGPGGGNMDPKQAQAIQMMSRMATQMREQMELESLVKPTSQYINEDTLEWIWPLPEGVLVRATLYKHTKVYHIQLVAISSDDVLTSDAATLIGNAITSASRWEKIWKQHAGEYLIEDDEADDLQPQRHD